MVPVGPNYKAVALTFFDGPVLRRQVDLHQRTREAHVVLLLGLLRPLGAGGRRPVPGTAILRRSRRKGSLVNWLANERAELSRNRP